MTVLKPLSLLLVLAATLPTPAAAAPLGLPGDTITAYQLGHGWFTRDKVYHFTASAVGAGGVYALARESGLGRWTSAIGAAVVMGAAGLLRETYRGDDPNRLTRTIFSSRDMAWNLAGIAVGISLTDVVGRSRWRARDEPPLQPVPETHMAPSP